MLKGIIPLISAAVIIAVTAGCNEVDLRSNRISRDLTVDGRTADWVGTEQLYDRDNGYKLGFANDGKSLYMAATVWNDNLKRKILRDGLTLSVRNNGKYMGLHYPMKPAGLFSMKKKGSFERMKGGKPEEGLFREGMNGRMLDSLVSQALEVELITQEEVPGKIIPVACLNDECGAEVALRFENRSLTYEFRIPLHEIKDNMEQSKILITLETGEIEVPERLGRPEGMGAPPGGGRSGFAGGGRRGGGMGGPPVRGGASEGKFSLRIHLELDGSEAGDRDNQED